MGISWSFPAMAPLMLDLNAISRHQSIYIGLYEDKFVVYRSWQFEIDVDTTAAGGSKVFRPKTIGIVSSIAQSDLQN